MIHTDRIHFSFFESIASCFNKKIEQHSHFSVSQSPSSVWQNILFNPSESREWNVDEFGQIRKELNVKNWPTMLMTNSNTSLRVRKQLRKHAVKKSEWISMKLSLPVAKHALNTSTLSVRKVVSTKDFYKWISILETSLMKGKLNASALKHWIGMEEITMLLGLVEGEPVCASLGYRKGEDLGVYLVATHENHRSKGFGTKITQELFFQPSLNTCKTAYLYATPLGFPVYKKMGFVQNGVMEVFSFG